MIELIVIGLSVEGWQLQQQLTSQRFVLVFYAFSDCMHQSDASSYMMPASLRLCVVQPEVTKPETACFQGSTFLMFNSSNCFISACEKCLNNK